LDDDIHDPIVVPHTELAAEVLRRVVEAFVLREGTEYGAKEFSLEAKVAHVMRQLDMGKAHIIFDPASQSVNLLAGAAAKPRR
jgi:uncharacterized protein